MAHGRSTGSSVLNPVPTKLSQQHTKKMKYFAVVVLALFACQGCLAKPKPKVEKDQLDELVQNVQNVAKGLGEQLGVQNLDDISNTVQENTKKLAETLKGYVDKIDAERKAHSGEINTGLKTIQDKLTATVADLQKAAGPDATKKAEEIKVEFDKAYKSTVDQMKQFYESNQVKDVQENVNKMSKSLLDSMFELGETFQKQVKTAVEEHEKTHKH